MTKNNIRALIFHLIISTIIFVLLNPKILASNNTFVNLFLLAVGIVSYLLLGFYLANRLNDQGSGLKNLYSVSIIAVIGFLIWAFCVYDAHNSNNFLAGYVWIIYEYYNGALLPALLNLIDKNYRVSQLGVPEWTLILTFIPSILIWCGWEIKRCILSSQENTEKENQNAKRLLKPALIILGSILVLSAVTITYLHEKSPASNKTAWAVKDGNWIYYKDDNEHILWLTQYRLYKMKEDGSERTKISDDTPEDINIVNDWVYYINSSDNSNIYRIKKDGAQREKLSDFSVADIEVSGDELFYINDVKGDDWKNKNVYKMRLDGTEIKQLTRIGNLHTLAIYEDWVFYSHPDGIFKVSRDGENERQLVNERTSKVSIYKNYLYFIDRFSITLRIDLLKTGEVESELLIPSTKHAAITDDWYYYLVRDKDKLRRLYRAKLDLSAQTKLSDDPVENVNVAGDWIFYNNLADNGKIYLMSTDGGINKRL